MRWFLIVFLLVACHRPSARLDIEGLQPHSVETDKLVAESLFVMNTGRVPLIVIQVDGKNVRGPRPLILPGQSARALPDDDSRILRNTALGSQRWNLIHVDAVGHHIVKHSALVVAPPETFISAYEDTSGIHRPGADNALWLDLPDKIADPPADASSLLAIPGPRLAVHAEFSYDVVPDSDIQRIRKVVHVTAFRKNLPWVGTAVETPNMSYLLDDSKIYPIGHVSMQALDWLTEWIPNLPGKGVEGRVYAFAGTHGPGSMLRRLFGSRYEKTAFPGCFDDPYCPSPKTPEERAQIEWSGPPEGMPGLIQIHLDNSDFPQLWRVLFADGTWLCPTRYPAPSSVVVSKHPCPTRAR